KKNTIASESHQKGTTMTTDEQLADQYKLPLIVVQVCNRAGKPAEILKELEEIAKAKSTGDKPLTVKDLIGDPLLYVHKNDTTKERSTDELWNIHADLFCALTRKEKYDPKKEPNFEVTDEYLAGVWGADVAAKMGWTGKKSASTHTKA